MSFERNIKRYFPWLPYASLTICSLIFVWLCLTLFTRTFGGPFPERTRGPLAKHDYYKLGEFDDWESIIDQPAGDGLQVSEALVESKPIPDLEFGTPPAKAETADDSSAETVQSASQP
ncbi:MAG: hypothetical protein GC154_11600 [bacterium]|nr:hypothetical protein [bacterium]